MNQNNPKQFLIGKQITIYRKNLGLDRDIIKKREHYHALSDFKPKHNEQGQRVCLNCNRVILDKRKRKYCSYECSQDFFAKHYSAGMRTKIFKRDKFTCRKCGREAIRNGHTEDPYSSYNYIVDHIIPIALGGAEFDESNLQLLCGVCNKEKTKIDQAKIAKKRSEIRLVRNPFAIEIKPIFVERPQGILISDFLSINTRSNGERKNQPA
ncbi:HNH endonuclease [Candidatus Bathyarchaeota archaeon]|nr:HNH endonuclease [Candidatus Bathyarchaeota archaeon]